MGITIGGVALFLVIAILIFWCLHKSDAQEKVMVCNQKDSDLHFSTVIQDCDCNCPCRQGQPHHHLIDQHLEVLKQHPNSFVALHPVRGVTFATPDIVEFTIHMNRLDHRKSLGLAVVHTSALQLSD